MKIIHFGQKNCMTREGGVEVVVNELAHWQVSHGNEVICINRKSHHVGGNEYDAEYISDYDNIKMEYVPTIDMKGAAAVSASFFASFKSAVSNADIIHIHAEGPGYFSFIPKFFRKKVVCHIHGLDWQRSKWKNSFASKFIYDGEKNIAKYADAIVVLNDKTKKYFKNNYGVNAEIIPNGVSAPTVVQAHIIKEKYGLDKNSYILYLSRLVPEKRADLLIDAYKKLNTDKKLVIAGGVSDTDDYCEQLKKLANDNENIVFTGFVEGVTLQELYSNSYVYVLPSDIEGMPLSLLEAMSYGNCCIVSDIDECVEVIEDKAMTFKKNNANSLLEKLKYCIENADMVKKYKSGSSDYILSKYSWDKTANQVMSIYEKVLNG